MFYYTDFERAHLAAHWFIQVRDLQHTCIFHNSVPEKYTFCENNWADFIQNLE